MKTITLKLDSYSKLVLTVIAIALIGVALRPFLPSELEANPQVVDVNIAEIGGYSQYGKTLQISGDVDANISGTVDVSVENTVDVNVENASDIGYWVHYYSE